jgi:hypothetical protein
VQGEVSPTTAAIGKKPQVLDLPHKLKKEFLKRCNSRQTLASYTSDKHTGDTLHIPAINLSGTDLLSSAYTTDIDSIVSNKIV